MAPLALASTAAALNELKVSGSNFVDSVTNERFNIVGVAYVKNKREKKERMDGID